MADRKQSGGNTVTMSGEWAIDTPEASTLGAEPPPLPVRDRDRYEMLGEHARGGLGRVWKARDRQLGRVVAIKEVLPPDEGARARFVREALVTARLAHPAIVPVYEAGRWPNGEPFYAMKLVSGRTLGAIAGERKKLADRMSLLPSVIAVADAIAYAHAQGVIHRDLKPSNVLCGDYGETVVIDWGLAKDLRGSGADPSLPDVASPAAGATLVGTVIGTPGFMAPEQARGETVDERADVYALGALLYYVLSGRAPHSGDTLPEVLAQVRAGQPRRIAELVSGVSADLAAIVDKAMEADPTRRYPTAHELVQDLKRYQTGQMVSAHDYSLALLVRRWIGRHRGVTLATAAFALVAAIGVVAFVAREQRLRHAAEAERDRADQKTLALLEGQGRALLGEGRPFQAAVYLVEAYRRNPESRALRWLVTQAVRPMARLERTLTGHTHDIPQVAYNKDGTRFVTASSDGTTRVWDSGDGHSIAVLHADDEWVDAAAFSPDGRRVASVNGRAIHLFDVETKRLLRTIDEPKAYRIWFTPDGARLIVGTNLGELRLRDAQTGALVDTVKEHTFRIQDLVFSPDGTRFAVASWDRAASVWDLATFRPLFTLRDHDAELSTVAYSADGEWLLTVENDAYMHVRRADTGARDHTIRLPEGASASRAAFAPDGQTIVTCSFDGAVRIWHASSGALLDVFDAQPSGRLMNSALRPDGRQLVTVGASGSVRLWRLDENPGYRLLRHRPDERTQLMQSEYVDGGRRVLTGDNRGKVAEWDAATGNRLRAFHIPGNAYSLAANRDGSRVLVTGFFPENIPPGLWDPATGQRVASLDIARLVHNVAASADGKTLATSSYDGTVRLIDSSTGGQLARFQVDSLRISAVAFRPDGRELAATNENGRLYLIDRVSGRTLRTIDAHSSWIDDVEYSRDGARLVTAGRQDQLAKVWDAATGRLLLTLSGHHQTVMRASFSPDGALIATAAVDHTANLWDARTGELLRTIVGPGYTAEFSPDGRELFTTGYRGYAAFWDLRLDERSPEQLGAYVAERSPWVLEEGRARLRAGAR